MTRIPPGFRNLLIALREPVRSWNLLLVVDTSRLARNVHLAESFKHECRKRGVKVLFSKVPEDRNAFIIAIDTARRRRRRSR